MDICPIRLSNEASLRALCLATTPLRRREESERFVIWQTYVQYYLDCEAAHCFAAVEDDTVIAAVLCAPDYADYMRRFSERVYPRCKAYGYMAAAVARQTALLQKKVAGRYPAHMQWLLPEARKDLAGPLFDAVAAHLEAMECRGVCVFPGRRQNALWEAMQALGFTLLGREGRMLIMGKELF